ncbi:hypothetical protein [Nostoc sp.]|uniref:hypothetical protein n=1 Tax=Nostoc sp. TaxID=1180 RepID=UPI002FF794FD
MPIYEESGLRITLPDEHSFRLQDCSSYVNLKGNNLSEMDFGWWDSTNDTLSLLEIKDYSHLTPLERLPDHLLEKLINKVTDSVMILASVWSGTLQGQNFYRELPVSCQVFPTHPKKIKVFFIFKISDEIKIKQELTDIRDKLKNKMLGRLMLFDITNLVLVDHETAIKFMGMIATV